MNASEADAGKVHHEQPPGGSFPLAVAKQKGMQPRAGPKTDMPIGYLCQRSLSQSFCGKTTKYIAQEVRKLLGHPEFLLFLPIFIFLINRSPIFISLVIRK